MTVSPRALDRLFDILERRAGLRRDVCDIEVARGLLASQADPTAWLDGIEHSGERLRPVLERFTVHESYLFRHPKQLEAFAKVVLGECREARSADRTLRVMSAGCAGGEEVWSIAIMLREQAAFLADWAVQIIALDASAPMIAKASAGRYGKWSLRATSDDARQRWFRPMSGGRWAVVDELRAGVSFETRNLVDPGPWPWEARSFDVIFFRNVAIYLSAEAFRSIIDRFEALLRPGGWLVLGPTETLRDLQVGFDCVSVNGAFLYQRHGARRLATPVAPVLLHPTASLTPWVPPQAPTPPTAPMAPTAPTDEALAASARVCLGRQDFEAALRVIAGVRDEGLRELLRAVALTNQGRHIEAAIACARVLALDPRSAAARYLSALGREHSGDLTGAWAEGQAAVDLDPTMAMPWVHLGLMARKRGDVIATRTFLTEAVARLAADQPDRIELFGGGFGRDALLALCRSQLRAVGSPS